MSIILSKLLVIKIINNKKTNKSNKNITKNRNSNKKVYNKLRGKFTQFFTKDNLFKMLKLENKKWMSEKIFDF